ncbi:MAG: hypothetical protein JWR00_2480 [Rubritepida sp.]|nr:hypothetical protein [Rubritepida sp.]
METYPQAWSGTITGRRAQIELRSDTPIETPPALRFSVTPGDGPPLVMKASRVRPLPTGAVYGVTLPDGFVRSVRTHLLDDKGELGPELPYGADYEILDLMPVSRNGLLPLTFMRKNRIRHLGTLQLLAEQVSTSPEYGPFVQIEAVKVLSYMAVEDGAPDAIDSAIRLIDAQVARLHTLPEDKKGSSKEHPRHILISLRFIRILASLMNGRPQEAMEDMASLAEHVPQVPVAPITAFNLGLALVLQAWILARGGETEEAVRISEAIVGIFRAAAANMPSAKSKIFAELGMTLQSATVAIDLVSGLKGRQPLEWDGTLSATIMARRYSRLTTNASVERLGRRLEEAAAYVAARHGTRDRLAG